MLAYTYHKERNPNEHAIAGVPLRDLSEADLARLPAHVREGIAHCGFYDAVAPVASIDTAAADDHTPAAVHAAVERDERPARARERK